MSIWVATKVPHQMKTIICDMRHTGDRLWNKWNAIFFPLLLPLMSFGALDRMKWRNAAKSGKQHTKHWSHGHWTTIAHREEIMNVPSSIYRLGTESVAYSISSNICLSLHIISKCICWARSTNAYSTPVQVTESFSICVASPREIPLCLCLWLFFFFWFVPKQIGIQWNQWKLSVQLDKKVSETRCGKRKPVGHTIRPYKCIISGRKWTLIILISTDNGYVSVFIEIDDLSI